MNDYLIERYSKHDLREFWSVLLNRKSELVEQLKEVTSDDRRSELRGEISALEYVLDQIGKTFDLF